jgi:hypothetical protein
MIPGKVGKVSNFYAQTTVGQSNRAIAQDEWDVMGRDGPESREVEKCGDGMIGCYWSGWGEGI